VFGRRKKPGTISAADLGEYGNPARGDVDITAAARGMGTSRTAVRQALAKAKSALSNTFMRGISGRSQADSSSTGSPLGKLQAAFGRGPRGGAVNTRQAADALGVAPATVRRWANGTQQPSPDHAKALTVAARRATSTKAGRRALIDDFRNSAKGKAAMTQGSLTTIRVAGYQGPSGQKARKDDYCRERVTPLAKLTPEHIEAMLRAYEQDGDEGLHRWMTDAAQEKDPSGLVRYHEDWEYITVDRFDIE
jgi:DNA-binding transcriptional regulator YdaS (Cro superfamily)